MDAMWIADIILGLIVIYYIFIHGYVLARREFKCIRCGKCCCLRVNLPEKDIRRIEKAGYKDFIKGKNTLKKVNGYCIFMTLDNGITSCKLEKSAKPELCKNFPCIEGCFGKKYDVRCKSFNKFNIMH